MANWRQVLAHLVVDVEDQFDRLKYGLGDRLGRHRGARIRPYRGYGTPERLYLKGRVLEDQEAPEADDNDSLWENLLNMYRRFESDEIPHARVRVRFRDFEQEAQADEEGYFECWITPTRPLEPDRLWHPVELELVEPFIQDGSPVRAEGEVFVPQQGAAYGVISDIDDTVLQTDAAHLLRMARMVFLGNARTRLPFKGVAAFYRALFKGPTGVGANPMFYVSSSPWNFYGLLSEFFNLQDIPIGPILILRDWGISEEELLPLDHRAHKLAAVRQILDLYPNLKFILIGDSSQEDPEIYAEVVEQYPQRILAIYIRNVTPSLKRPKAVRELAKRVAEQGSTLILADDTVPMAEHAAAQGWILPETLPLIREEKHADEAPPNPVEKALGVLPAQPAQAPTVVVQAGDPQSTKDAVEAGAIEDALKIEKGKDQPPPTVKVSGS